MAIKACVLPCDTYMLLFELDSAFQLIVRRLLEAAHYTDSSLFTCHRDGEQLENSSFGTVLSEDISFSELTSLTLELCMIHWILQRLP